MTDLTFSRSIVRRWNRLSAIGLLIAGLAWAVGEVIGNAFEGDVRSWVIPLRMIGAALRGGGLGATVLFMITLIAGLAFLLLDRNRGSNS